MHRLSTHTDENIRRFVVTAALLMTEAPLGAQACRTDGQTAFSQQSAASALSVLQSSIDALGGTAALRRINTITRDMSGPRTDIGQGGTMQAFEPTYSSIGPVPKAVNESRTISVRDLKRFRSSEHVRYSIYGGQRVDRRAVIADTEAFNAYYDYIYRGLRAVPASALTRTRAAAFRRHPESLLLGALGRPEALRCLGRAQFEGKPQNVLSYADVDGAQLTLFVDAQTHRLTKFETLGEDGVLGDLTNETVYQDYRPVRDVVLPFHYVDRRAGVVLDDQRAASIVLDLPLSDTLFQRPPGLDVVDFGAPFPNLQRLGDDVYAVLGGYNTIFVVFNGYVLVLEPGGSVREAETVIAKIKETAPGKPIRYVVATHWNFDHLGGVRPYVAEGATFIAPKSAHPAIARAAAAARPLHPDALSRQPRSPSMETLGSKERTFTDGVHTVVVYDISPSPHVSEMYIAYLPKERTLFEADMLDIVVPGKTGSAGEDTADLADKIARLGLQVDRIVPVHGQMGTMEDLRQALSRRAAARRLSTTPGAP